MPILQLSHYIAGDWLATNGQESTPFKPASGADLLPARKRGYL